MIMIDWIDWLVFDFYWCVMLFVSFDWKFGVVLGDDLFRIGVDVLVLVVDLIVYWDGVVF